MFMFIFHLVVRLNTYNIRMNEQLEKLFGANFKLRDIDPAPIANSMGLLSLNLLESNEIFRFLKSELEIYYKEKNKSPHRQIQNNHRSQAWKEHFYHSLQSLLNEVTYTNDNQLKEYRLTKIYKWYAEKSQRALERPKIKTPPTIQEETVYPYIPQKIESTVQVKRARHLPKIPKALSLSQELPSIDSYLAIGNSSVRDSPARTARSRRLFRPYLKSSKEPIMIDFRASSVGNQDCQRMTNYTDRESLEKTNKEIGDIKVPFIRRQQFKEVSLIKQRLAAKNMCLPIRVLENGLVFSDFTQEIVPPILLPRGGELLMHDLVNDNSTKKKKKKGKKAKAKAK